MQRFDVEGRRSSRSSSSHDAMTIFAGFEADYLRIARLLSGRLSELQALAAGGRAGPGSAARLSASTIVAAAEREFEQGEMVVRGLSVEARSMRGKGMAQCGLKAQQYREDLESMRRSFQQLKHRVLGTSPNGGDLSGGVVRPPSVQPDSLRTSAQLEDGLQRSRAIVMDSQKVIAATQGIGVEVIDDLESQRESLLGSQQRMRGVARTASEAGQALRDIERREKLHRMKLYAIIVGLLCAIAFVLYLRLR